MNGHGKELIMLYTLCIYVFFIFVFLVLPFIFLGEGLSVLLCKGDPLGIGFVVIWLVFFIFCVGSQIKNRIDNKKEFNQFVQEIASQEDYTKEELKNKIEIASFYARLEKDWDLDWLPFLEKERKAISKEGQEIWEQLNNTLQSHYSTRKERVELEEADNIWIKDDKYYVFVKEEDTRKQMIFLLSNTVLYKDTDSPYMIIEYKIYENKMTNEYKEYKDTYKDYFVELHIPETMEIIKIDNN